MRAVFLVYFCAVLAFCNENFSVLNSDKRGIGAEYLGVRYEFSPLGEEAWPDFGPLIRFDAFDCVTFVETALAGGDLAKLTQIRYKNGEVEFLNRNHFFESDWLKNNAAIVKNVSGEFGAVEKRVVLIDKAAWLQKNFNIVTNSDPVAARLDYVPYKSLQKLVGGLVGDFGEKSVRVLPKNLGEHLLYNAKNYEKNLWPTRPLIVAFLIKKSAKIVRELGSDLAVTHVGFLLPGGIFRHASSDKKMVVDMDFGEYIAKKAKNKQNLGVMFLEF